MYFIENRFSHSSIPELVVVSAELVVEVVPVEVVIVTVVVEVAVV